MKVGDNNAEKRAEQNKANDGDKKNRSEPKRDRGQKFSELMGEKQPRRAELRGDERKHRLERGEVQQRSRELASRRQKERSDVDRRRNSASEGAPPTSDRNTGEGKSNPICGEIGASAAETSGSEQQASVPGVAADGSAEELREVEAVTERVGSKGEVDAGEPSRLSEPAVQQIAREIVEAVRVGEDEHRRQVVFLDVTVPERGEVRIRLRRDGGGMEVRMRADNDALARTLQQNTDGLRRAAGAKDIELTSVRVVR